MPTNEKKVCQSLNTLIHQCQNLKDIDELCLCALNILQEVVASKNFYAVLWREKEEKIVKAFTVGKREWFEFPTKIQHDNNISQEQPLVRVKKHSCQNIAGNIFEVILGEIEHTQLFVKLYIPMHNPGKTFLQQYFGVLHTFLKNVELSARNDLLLTIIEHCYNTIEITDNEAIIEYVNPAFEKVTQYTREEAVGHSVASLLRSPEENPGLFEEIKACLSKGERWKGHFKSLRKNKSTWHALASVIPFRENGKITKHIAIKQDLTEQREQFNKLISSEQKYMQILKATIEPIFVHDLNGRIMEVNQAACDVLKYTREELLNFYVWDIEIGVTMEKLNQIWSILEKEPLILEGQHRKKDGQYFPVEVKLSSFSILGEKLIIAMVRDISERKIAESQIRKLTSAVEQSPVFIFITNTNGKIEYANKKVLETYGKPSLVIGKSLQYFFSSDINPLNEHNVWNLLKSGQQWKGELLSQIEDGNALWVSAHLSSLRNEQGEINHYLAVMEDTTEKKSYEAMLKHQALNDHLTHLPNRFHGINHLEKRISEKKNISGNIVVFFLDLDAFKKVNDTLGHSTGDKLLREISNRFVNISRPTDMIVRLGGDEFMIIIEDCSDLENIKKIAQKFLDVCTKPMLMDEYELLTTASIGIALYPQHGSDAKTLMSLADTAMYESKRNGKNCWTIYHKKIRHTTKRYIDVKSEIVKAFERNELELHYQPIINTETNQLVGAESLLRWYHKTLGYINPEQAILVAEETGIIHQLGIWILQKACEKIRQWNQCRADPLFIAVNISPSQLKSRRFAAQAQNILLKSGIPPDYLYLEITENALIDNSEHILHQLSVMSESGIQCTIDDFGVGYSSLNYLTKYPFKCLKIDKSFVQGLQSNSNDIHLINSIIAMCQNLNLTVIAEGVETEEQLNILKKLNCKFMQGWYFDMALQEEEFLKRIS